MDLAAVIKVLLLEAGEFSVSEVQELLVTLEQYHYNKFSLSLTVTRQYGALVRKLHSFSF